MDNRLPSIPENVAEASKAELKLFIVDYDLSNGCH